MSTKLYVGNLPYAAEEQQLQALFAEGGRQVVSVRLLMDRETGRGRGFGFVEMGSEADALQAIDALNGREFMGRALTVNEARPEKKAPDASGFREYGSNNPRGRGRKSHY